MAEPLKWLARISFQDHDGVLVLNPDWTWFVEGGDVPENAWWIAKIATTAYAYSPSHGWPGAYLASKVARSIQGGKLELPEYPPLDPDVVY